MCGRSVKAGGRHWGIKADRINSLLGPFFSLAELRLGTGSHRETDRMRLAMTSLDEEARAARGAGGGQLGLLGDGLACTLHGYCAI